MVNAVISGCFGKMGRVVADVISKRDDIEVVAGIDKVKMGELQFETVTDPKNLTSECKPDVIIDFSHPSALPGLLDYAKTNGTALVLATTGYSEQDISDIKSASSQVPIFFTANMSIGINLLSALAKKAATILGDSYDIEIVEKHHNQKIDAPSGTALMLADSINQVRDERYNYIYDRHSSRKKRDKTEIGIHSVRGGTIVGEHEIIFAGRDEVITLSHSAASKEVFAVGAVNAAVFLSGKPAGMYSMQDLIEASNN
ncbi:MAG: 4-hydroxy-tetrahydrodipicolinate reductase [Oscillospiraceae bacterium]|nr:4-hydroxy-tetrahydrodipicolinate reductase [Oscillospiraceae bacterium]